MLWNPIAYGMYGSSSIARMNDCLHGPSSITHPIRTYIGYLQMTDWVSLFLVTPVRVRLHKTTLKLQWHLWPEAVLDLCHRNIISHVSMSIHFTQSLTRRCEQTRADSMIESRLYIYKHVVAGSLRMRNPSHKMACKVPSAVLHDIHLQLSRSVTKGVMARNPCEWM